MIHSHSYLRRGSRHLSLPWSNSAGESNGGNAPGVQSGEGKFRGRRKVKTGPREERTRAPNLGVRVAEVKKDEQ
jgi:hypothetical protein